MLGMTYDACRWPRASLLRSMLACILALACCAAFGAAPRSLRFDRLSIEQGMSQESVLNILQDRQGFMWFGTQAGLNRYDGYRVTVFRNEPQDPNSLVDNFVNASFEDEQGRLWFGTKGGLTRYDAATQHFVRYLANDGRHGTARNRAVNAIVADGHGGLWLATGDGLKHFDPASGRTQTFRHDEADPASLCDDRVSALAIDGSGALWVGTSDGLDRLAPGTNRFEHHDIDPAPDSRGNMVLALSMGPRDTLWIGTGTGLEAWRLGEGAPQRRHLGPAEGIGAGRVLSVYHDRGANLWVGTEFEGLKWHDPASGRFVGYANTPLDQHSLSDNQVSAIFVDRTGTLWGGTFFGGVNRADLASGGFTRLAFNDGTSAGAASAKVRAITGAPDGRLWVGTFGAGLVLLDPASGRTERQRHDPRQGGSLPDDIVTALAQARDRLWVGTPTGLAWRDPASGRFTRFPLGGDNPDEARIQSLRLDSRGVLWIVTRGGLYALEADGRTLRKWRHDPLDPSSLGENYGYSLLEDRHGTIWVGTENGLDRFDRASGKFTHFRHDPANPASLRHSRVYYLFESRRGELWVGTAGGLHRLEPGANGKSSFRFFPVTNANEAVPIGAVQEDGQGVLWISTTLGISRLDPASGAYKAYSAKDGLIDGSYFVGAAWKGPDGMMYFGGIRGMSEFSPESVRDNPYPPPVVITGFSVGNQWSPGGAMQSGQEVTLSYRDTVFTLEFAALHYADPSGNRYAYQLEGFDDSWIDADAGKRYATYTNLDPGRYVFRVRASNKDGVWSERPATLVITITPPFWKTWWFRTLALLALVGAVYGGYRLRVRALVQQKQTLAREVGARTGELRLQKEALERRNEEIEHQKEVVEQAHRNISLLSDIGRRLTANLDREAIMATLYEHVHELMDASVFALAVHQRDRDSIDYPFAVIESSRCAPLERPLATPHQLAAWCIGHGREVFIGDVYTEAHDYLPNSQPASVARMALPSDDSTAPAPRSLLYVPIVVGSRVFGALTVQSFVPAAYQRVHLDMLRTLASYVAVALDNARAYRHLKEAQAQLASQEKLASLGSLVAGVAHELNTPIGNSLLMASTLHEKTDRMAARFEDASLRRSDLESWIAASREASGLMMRSLHNAADLVNSFRQVSVDQASAQRRRFDLAQACHEIAATMMNKVRRDGHILELRVPAGIAMDSFPGPLGQVLINFVNNALLHAFEAPGGHMLLQASTPEPGRVQVEFSDDGRGIAPEHLARIFDPFFTTRMGQGGTGLGLSIAYNIATSLLKGAIRVDSAPGRGTTFILDLPLVAADACPADPAAPTHGAHA
jgi:ligand-binding sensor domain-containing protein/signal transduction histidine kinase